MGHPVELELAGLQAGARPGNALLVSAKARLDDELKISSGRSDIGGHISVFPSEPRPRLVARLHSDQIYLRELLPVSETEAAPEAATRVIPDYNPPLEHMREFDGELEFKGKRLHITLRLSGSGRTCHEFLGGADGQLIIVGQEGKFGSRRLDLWGSDLVTIMLSREWRREDVTDLNCLVARVRIEDGIASSDDLQVDTQRITIGAAGTLYLESEELDLVITPRPKRASLVSITSPVHSTGTLAAPEVEVTVLPRRRMAAAGCGLLAGLVNPVYLLFSFSQIGSRQANACAAAVEEAMVMKGRADELDTPPSTPSPRRFSLLPGCTPSGQRPVH